MGQGWAMSTEIDYVAVPPPALRSRCRHRRVPNVLKHRQGTGVAHLMKRVSDVSRFSDMRLLFRNPITCQAPLSLQLPSFLNTESLVLTPGSREARVPPRNVHLVSGKGVIP